MNSVQESRSRHSTQWPMAAGSCNGIHPRLSCLRSLWEGFLAITHGADGYSNRTLEEVASYRTWDSFAAKKVWAGLPQTDKLPPHDPTCMAMAAGDLRSCGGP